MTTFNSVVQVTLPHGLWVGGVHQRVAGLRPPTGRDEAYLLSLADHLAPPQWATALLTRCLAFVGQLAQCLHHWSAA